MNDFWDEEETDDEDDSESDQSPVEESKEKEPMNMVCFHALNFTLHLYTCLGLYLQKMFTVKLFMQ